MIEIILLDLILVFFGILLTSNYVFRFCIIRYSTAKISTVSELMAHGSFFSHYVSGVVRMKKKY